MARKTSADIRAEIAEYTATAQALLDLAKEANEGQGRDLDAEEEVHFNEVHAKLETAKAELEKVEAFEAKRREVAEMQALQSQPLAPIGGLSVKGASERLKAHHRLGPMTAFKGPDAVRDAYDSGMWLRALIARMKNSRDEEAEARVQTRGWQVMNVATEGTPSAGGYLVPTPLANAIIDVRALAGVSRQVARVVPMTAETLNLAKKTAGTTVYYPGEGGAITASDQTWGQVQLTAKKRAILSKISQELRDDAIIAIVDDLASQMGTDFAVKEDAEFFKGDSTATYGGETGLLALLGAGGVTDAATGHDTWPELDIADFTAAMAKLPDKYWQYGPVWCCSSVFYFTAMLRVLASAGGNAIASLEQGPNNRPIFLGHPVYFTNQMPTSTAAATVCALFGAFNQAAVIGDRMGISIAQSEHLNFAEDLLAVRATTRYDINVHDSGDGSTAGAYVGLKTAS